MRGGSKMKAFSRCFLVGLALVFTLSIVGCGGGGDSGGGTGGGATSSLVAQSYDEQCAFCHGAGKEPGCRGGAFYRNKQPAGNHHSRVGSRSCRKRKTAALF